MSNHIEINAFDVGALGGPIPHWLRNDFVIHCFEPNESECTRLNQEAKYKNVLYHPVALTGENKEYTLYITKDPRLSSLLPPDFGNLSRFEVDKIVGENAFDIDIKQSVTGTRIDDFMQSNHIRSLDLIKLDTQGTELEILKSAGKRLETTLLAEVEVGFTPLYEGAVLFGDIFNFMYKKGFDLFDLKRHVWRRGSQGRQFDRGQLIFGDSIFIKRPEYIQALNLSEVECQQIILKAEKVFSSYGFHGAVEEYKLVLGDMKKKHDNSELYKNEGYFTHAHIKLLRKLARLGHTFDKKVLQKVGYYNDGEVHLDDS